MALSGAERQKRLRERKKAAELGLPEPDYKAQEELKNADIQWAASQDATGKFFKSECRSLTKLLAIYSGASIANMNAAEEEADEDEAPRRRKKVKEEDKERPNPSRQRVQVRAIERIQAIDGLEFTVPINPDDEDNNLEPLMEVDEIVSFRRWLDLRDKARKNLFWLARLLGKEPYAEVHQEVCDQFVQKDFDGMYRPGYTLGDFHRMIKRQKRFDNYGNPCREMMLLDSRGFFKSTLDGIDAVSWVINAPDIRILIITGENSLATSFLQEIKAYFGIPEGAEPTPFNLLFPEFVLTGVAIGSTKPMKCPARILKQKGNTIWTNSIVSNLSGWHCDVKKGDDIVTDANSESEETRAKLKKKYDGTKDILDPHGIADHIGTRYFTDDWYGTRLTVDKKTGRPVPIKYYSRGAFTRKPEYADENRYPLKELTEDQVVLTFPQKQDWETLMDYLRTSGERAFKNQKLNIATDVMEENPYIYEFKEEELNPCWIPRTSVPQYGDIIQVWDISFSDKKTSDYSVGVTAFLSVDKYGVETVYIMEIVFGKWNSSELVFQMLQFYKKWPMTSRIRMEKVNGAETLKDSLALYSNHQRHAVPEFTGKFRLIDVDTQPNAKRNRIKSLELLRSQGRLFFVNGPWRDETMKQLLSYSGKKSTTYRKDDIPDALSQVVACLSRASLLPNADPATVEQEWEQRRASAQMRANYDRMFNGQSPGTLSTARTWGNGPMPQQQPTEPGQQQDPRRAMMNRLFGGNGLRA